eukprot:COSAG01_NODE_16285_length_1250_cov_24.827107_2_plen_124_part_00
MAWLGEARERGRIIKAPWLVNGGHGALLRHHKAAAARRRAADQHVRDQLTDCPGAQAADGGGDVSEPPHGRGVKALARVFTRRSDNQVPLPCPCAEHEGGAAVAARVAGDAMPGVAEHLDVAA